MIYDTLVRLGSERAQFKAVADQAKHDESPKSELEPAPKADSKGSSTSKRPATRTKLERKPLVTELPQAKLDKLTAKEKA
jgi:hypothetical protein